MSKTREAGYYWVRTLSSEWKIAKWNPSCGLWFFFGASITWFDSDFTEIDENKIERK